MSLGLLGAYDSDSSSSSEEEEEKPKEQLPKPSLANPFKKQAPTLPKPSFMVAAKDYTAEGTSSSRDNSVFSNPFRAKEEQKKAVLEKHVEMTTRQEDLRKIDGKKICWNFRKGRCRFGHKCTFAHDSDVNVAIKTRENAEARAEGQEGAIIDTKGAAPQVNVLDGTAKARPGAKRPGLSQTLVPGKKAMKFHERVYNEKK